VWIILFCFLLLLLFPFLFCICSRRFSDYARLCEKNRKSWPALQHRFLFFFLSPFSRVRLASDPSCSGFLFVSVDFVLVQYPVCYINGMTKSFLYREFLSADRLRNRILREMRHEISPMVVHVIIRETNENISIFIVRKFFKIYL